MTDSKASMLMRWKIASRRLPALLRTPSSLPKLSTAILTILLAGMASATVSKFGTAVPPRCLISSTTSSAGEAFAPEPSACLEIRHRGAAALLDFLDHFLGRRGVRSRAVRGDAGIVDHDLGPLGRAEQGDFLADAAPGAGNDDGFAFE